LNFELFRTFVALFGYITEIGAILLWK